MENNNNIIALPPRSSRRNRRVCATAVSYNSQEKHRLDKQYRAITYSEMMQTKVTSERLTLYEKTFELCMRADPQLTAWIKRVQDKGLPKAMTEDYKPRYSTSSSLNTDASSTTSTMSTSSNSSNNSNHHGFSIFLRKASTSSRNSATTPSLPPTEPLKSSASRFIATSFSKLSSLSRQPQSCSIASRLSLPNFQSSNTTTSTTRRRSYDKSSNSIVPSASSKIKRRLSSLPQRRLSTSIISSPQLDTANSSINGSNNNNRDIQTIPIKPSITTSISTTPTDENTLSRIKDNNNNYNNTNKKSLAPVPSHSLLLQRLRLRRSHESMAGVNNISNHTNKFVAVRV